MEEIKRLVDAAHTLRDKAIILLLASSGMRRGAIINLQIKHLKKIEVYNSSSNSVFLIDVYKQAREHYFTFCTPEATKAIEEYLNWRDGKGEKLTPESPLFREQFDIRFGARGKVTPITETAITHMLNTLRNETGIVEHKPLTESVKNGSHRSKIMTAHGFRKFFMTECEKSGMKSINVKMLLGHDIGVSGHYYRPAESDILEDYMAHAADALTIDDTQRLKQENAELRKTQSDYLAELGDLRHDFDEMKQLLVHLSKESQKQLVDEFHQKVGDKADIEWSCD